MNLAVNIIGEPVGVLAALPGELREACGAVASAGDVPAPRLLINLAPAANLAIAAAASFAESREAGEQDRLIVTIWPKGTPKDWEAYRQAAELGAFTRHAALAWAPRRVRVNAVTFHSALDLQSSTFELADTLLAIWRWRSMTGQIINLGG